MIISNNDSYYYTLIYLLKVRKAEAFLLNYDFNKTTNYFSNKLANL
jgi:hypothetical protein